MERSDGSRDHRSTVLSRDPKILDKIMSVKDLLIGFEKLEMDLVEFAFFKIIVLFNAGNSLDILKVLSAKVYEHFELTRVLS